VSSTAQKECEETRHGREEKKKNCSGALLGLIPEKCVKKRGENSWGKKTIRCAASGGAMHRGKNQKAEGPM